MAVTVRVINNLPRFTQATELKAERAITQVLITGAAHAAVMTPVDTSFLLNSQYRRVTKQGAKIIGNCGYVADYAEKVHSHAYPQRFRRSTAEKEFLTKGFDESLPFIDRIVKEALKA